MFSQAYVILSTGGRAWRREGHAWRREGACMAKGGGKCMAYASSIDYFFSENLSLVVLRASIKRQAKFP